jgi:D-alanyl-D-alanine carboxypeptidase/D-alanyl-D-alanine-endopeptidase (penicillin-binding protein 4)
MTMKRVVWLLTVGVLLALPAGAVDLQPRVEAVLRGADLRGTQVAVVAIDARTGQTLCQIRADRSMMPASNMKLVTAAAALRVFGPDRLLTTRISMLPADGAGPPDVVVTGDGDPAFGDPVLLDRAGLDLESLIDLWVQAVAGTGERHIARLVIDDRVMDRQFVHPSWPADQLNRHYAAEVAGLNFHANVLHVTPTPTRTGEAPRLLLAPDHPGIGRSVRATTGGSDAFWMSRSPTRNSFTFHGTVRHEPARPYRVTLHDPPMFFGRLLAHRLGRAGVRVDEVVRADDRWLAPPMTELHRVNTSLAWVLQRMNQDSVNLYAEALLKRMGRELTGSPGSFASGGAAVRQVIGDAVQPHGVRVGPLTVADGSGLSRDNRVTARLLATLLVAMHQDDELGPTFRESLAQAGQTGTLRRRLRDIDGTVLGKSGYIRSVSALSGYLLTADAADALQGPDIDEPGGGSVTLGEATPSAPGELGDQPGEVIAFSILCNGFGPPLSNQTMKDLQDRIVRAMDDALAEEAQRAAEGVASAGN